MVKTDIYLVGVTKKSIPMLQMSRVGPGAFIMPCMHLK